MNTHSHAGHGIPSGDTKALIITGWLTGIYFIVELGIGLWTGSIAVISDAFHTFSAVGGVLIALVAGKLAQRGPTPTGTYGMIRAEIVGALFNGLFLVIMAGIVLWMGWMRIMEPIDLPTGPMLLAAAGGLVTEFISLGLLIKRQKTSLNVRGAFWHILQTFVGSLIIIVSALVIRFTGFLTIDPLLGMAFGLVLFWASWGIIRDALGILLERTPSHLDMNQIMQEIHAIKGVKDIHHIHAWTLTSEKDIFSAHVCVEADTNHEQILRQIHDMLRDKFSIYFSTIQIEKTCFDRAIASEIDITKSHN